MLPPASGSRTGSRGACHHDYHRGGTPKEVVQRLSQALRAALASEPVRERFRRDGAEAGSTSPEEFTEFLRQDMQRTMKVVV